jgi:hypothetical protein
MLPGSFSATSRNRDFEKGGSEARVFPSWLQAGLANKTADDLSFQLSISIKYSSH